MTTTASASWPGFAPEALPRLLPVPPMPTLADHHERFGPFPHVPSLITEVERSGLRGKGGAGFPTAVKMAAVATRRQGVVVANGTEGEPASTKDKMLLSAAPHLVIDGAMLAAEAVGASEIVVCVDRSARRQLAAIEAAIGERISYQMDRIPIRLVQAPTRYLTGEESALVHWLNGGDAKPTVVPPRPFERGVGGRPTLIQNVETLAHIALIARFGAEWFRSLGTQSDPGTTLLTLSGGFARPGVYEVPMGATLSSLLAAAGTAPADLGAILVGGYFGTWIPTGMMAGVDLGVESLAGAGAGLGAGVIAGLPAGACGLAESARIARWLFEQNAGQCGPCVHGLESIAWAMDILVRGDVNGQAQRRLDRWLVMVKGRGACRLPDGAARFVESSIRVFWDEINAHRHRGPCRANAGPLFPLPKPGGWR